MTKMTVRLLLFGLILVSSVAISAAQTPSPTPDDEPDFIVPARPTVSNPAEFQRPGVLQVELGYDANFHSSGSFNYQQDVPLALRFAVNRRLLLEFDTDSPFSQKDVMGLRNTG